MKSIKKKNRKMIHIIKRLENEFRDNIHAKFKDEELRVSDENGWSVAHELAYSGYTDFTPEQMKIKSDNGWTIAHSVAFKHGYKCFDDKGLKISSNHGFNCFTEEELKMKSNDGKSVSDVLKAFKNKLIVKV